MSVHVVVPCRDEANRLDVGALARLADAVDGVTIVDDGSTDATPRTLGVFSDGRADVRVLTMTTNVGKAEAVRVGMLDAIERGATIVGYLDADLSTPIDEMVRLIDTLVAQPRRAAVLGSRVALLGHTVVRRPTRHYLGRLYATAASLTLGVPVYDTQCGAKAFRVGTPLQLALADPFHDRWSFDVELLGRLLAHPDQLADPIIEVPLRSWRDVGGSKMSVAAGLRATVALLGVRRRVRSHRRRYA